MRGCIEISLFVLSVFVVFVSNVVVVDVFFALCRVSVAVFDVIIVTDTLVVVVFSESQFLADKSFFP